MKKIEAEILPVITMMTIVGATHHRHVPSRVHHPTSETGAAIVPPSAAAPPASCRAAVHEKAAPLTSR
jgi:hypothetical protein